MITAHQNDDSVEVVKKKPTPEIVQKTLLTRSETIQPKSMPKSKKAVKKPIIPSDYYTPKRGDLGKKKPRPPAAPRIRPVPQPRTVMEVLDLTNSGVKVVYDLTGGEPKPDPNAVETPGRVIKRGDDVIVDIEGIQLSMNEIFNKT